MKESVDTVWPKFGIVTDRWFLSKYSNCRWFAKSYRTDVCVEVAFVRVLGSVSRGTDSFSAIFVSLFCLQVKK